MYVKVLLVDAASFIVSLNRVINVEMIYYLTNLSSDNSYIH